MNEMKDYSHANRGRKFEKLINDANERYRINGDACIVKIPTEFLPIRNSQGKIVSCKVQRKSTVDYIGRVKGQPIAIEAKHTENDRIRLDAVQPHQARFLDDWRNVNKLDCDGMACILVSFNLEHFYLIPWAWWKSMSEIQKSIKRTEIELWWDEVKCDSHGLDYLEGFLKQYD